MKKIRRLPPRSAQKPEDCWDLSSLFPDDDAWEKAFQAWENNIEGYEKFRGRLLEGPTVIAQCLEFDFQMDRQGERLGTYASLKVAEDMTNAHYQRMRGRFLSVASRVGQAASFIKPELLAIPRRKMEVFLNDVGLRPYRVIMERILRWRPHTLGTSEERILAMQTEMAETPSHVFHQLNNADMRFGEVEDEKGRKRELTHGNFLSFLQSPARMVRERAFTTFYEKYAEHQNTLAATLAGSVQKDVYYARVRNFPSAREAALFPDNIPTIVYDQLIETVRRYLPVLHQYYDLRRRQLRLRQLFVYDCYVPLVPNLMLRTTWDQAVDLVLKAVAPLGDEYVRILKAGLNSRWCDRYENRGKQSGAFSAGTYDGAPYILMNYQEDVFDHVFTLAHEAGHSMHSYYSAHHQPYHLYQYTIFVAEVASTFNEQLLNRYLMKHAKSDLERAYYISHEIDEIRGTIFRQTMFAEFEKIIHEHVEKGDALTVETFRAIYRSLLADYFGPDVGIPELLELECFRIPHFYRAFYVYKYATGLSAAIALADRVLNGGKSELEAYLCFLAAGCSKDPLDLLRDAGVDMEKPEPVAAAMERFGSLVDELAAIL
ncbi:MAG: oligoendopeptidase F [Thermogutta sp.]